MELNEPFVLENSDGPLDYLSNIFVKEISSDLVDVLHDEDDPFYTGIYELK